MMARDSITRTGARTRGVERRRSLAWWCSTEQVDSDIEPKNGSWSFGFPTVALWLALGLHQDGTRRGGGRMRRPLRRARKARERMARHFCRQVNCSAFCAKPRRKLATAASARAAGLALA